MGFNNEDIDDENVQASINAGTKIVLNEDMLSYLAQMSEAAIEADTPPVVIALTSICMYIIYMLDVDRVSIVNKDGDVQVHVVDTRGVADFMKAGTKLQ